MWRNKPDSLADELLGYIDFHCNRVKCRKIEHMHPQLNKRVKAELQDALF